MLTFRQAVFCRFAACLILLAAVFTLPAQNNRINFNGQSLFLNGANFAWKNFATDVGPGTTDLAHFSSVFSQVGANGGNTMRLWIHTHGGTTPAWSGTGPTATVTGPGVGTISDITAILDRAWSNKVTVVLCLWSFDMLRTSFGANITDRARNILTNDAARGTYVTNALIPMVQALKDHPAIMAWEIFNEPEGMSLEHGWPDIVTTGRIPMLSVQKFVNHCASAIHNTDPEAKVSNGSWSFISQTDVGAGNFNYYRDDRLVAAGGYANGTLDFYMVHYYDWAGTTRSPFHNDCSYWGLTKPLVVAEFYPNVAEGCVNCGNNAYETLYQRGYAGALAWSWTDSSPSAMLALMAGMLSAHPADVFIGGNPPPQVTLTSPANGQTFPVGTAIPLAANATDNGSVIRVEFYQGQTKLGEDSTAPYQYSWTALGPGSFTLTARATDETEQVATSSPITLIIGANPGPSRFEAESASRTGTISVGSSAGASQGQYLYMQNDGVITWTIPGVPSAGAYNLSIGYQIPSGFGQKTQNLRVNGGSPIAVTFTLPENIWQTKVVPINLNAGSNTIAIEKSWGWMYFDYIELPFGSAPPNSPPVFSQTPPNRTVPELAVLTVTNSATDTDLPAQTLSYHLLNPPGNAAISAQGVITWTPPDAQGKSTNVIVTIVTDGLSTATNSFQVIVMDTVFPPVQMLDPVWLGAAGFRFSFEIPDGQPYTVEFSGNVVDWSDLTNGIGQPGVEVFTDPTATGDTRRYYRLRY